MNPDVETAFNTLAYDSDQHRKALLRVGAKKSLGRKFLTVFAGVLSLLSAGAMATALTRLVGKTAFEITGLIISIVSGVTSLLLTTIFPDAEVAKVYEGASRYLSLREAAYSAAKDPRLASPGKAFAKLDEFQKIYSQLDHEFARLHPMILHGTGWLGAEERRNERLEALRGLNADDT